MGDLSEQHVSGHFVALSSAPTLLPLPQLSFAHYVFVEARQEHDE